MNMKKIMIALMIFGIFTATASAQEDEVLVTTPSDITVSTFSDTPYWLEVSCSEGYSDESMRFNQFDIPDEDNHDTITSELIIPPSMMGKGDSFSEFKVKEIIMESTGDDNYNINVQLHHKNLTESFEGDKYCTGYLKMNISGFNPLPKEREFTFNIQANTTEDSSENAVSGSITESKILHKDWEVEYIKEDGSTMDWDGNEEAYHNHYGHDHFHPPNCEEEEITCDFSPDHTAEDHFKVCHIEAKLNQEEGEVYVDEEDCQDNYDYPGDAEMVCGTGSGDTVYVENLNCQKNYLHKDHLPGTFEEMASEDICSQIESEAMDKMDGLCSEDEINEYNFGQPKPFVCPYDSSYSKNIRCQRMETIFTSYHEDIEGWQPWEEDVEELDAYKMIEDDGVCEEVTISTVEFNEDPDDIYYRNEQECKSNIPLDKRQYDNTIKKCESMFSMLMEGSETEGTYSDMCGDEDPKSEDASKYKCAYNERYKTDFIACDWAKEQLSSSEHFKHYQDYSDLAEDGLLTDTPINQQNLALWIGGVLLAWEIGQDFLGGVPEDTNLDEMSGDQIKDGIKNIDLKNAVKDAYETTRMVTKFIRSMFNDSPELEKELFGTDPEGNIKGPSIPKLPSLPDLGESSVRFESSCSSDNELAIFRHDSFDGGECINPNDYCQEELSESSVWDRSSGVGKVKSAEEVCIEKDKCAEKEKFWDPETQDCASSLSIGGSEGAYGYITYNGNDIAGDNICDGESWTFDVATGMCIDLEEYSDSLPDCTTYAKRKWADSYNNKCVYPTTPPDCPSMNGGTELVFDVDEGCVEKESGFEDGCKYWDAGQCRPNLPDNSFVESFRENEPDFSNWGLTYSTLTSSDHYEDASEWSEITGFRSVGSSAQEDTSQEQEDGSETEETETSECGMNQKYIELNYEPEEQFTGCMNVPLEGETATHSIEDGDSLTGIAEEYQSYTMDGNEYYLLDVDGDGNSDWEDVLIYNDATDNNCIYYSNEFEEYRLYNAGQNGCSGEITVPLTAFN